MVKYAVCAVLISNAVAAFWVSALGSGDHCLGRFVLPPNANSSQLDKCQSSISVFVYFVFLLPVQQFSLPRPTAPNKRVNKYVFLHFRIHDTGHPTKLELLSSYMYKKKQKAFKGIFDQDVRMILLSIGHW